MRNLTLDQYEGTSQFIAEQEWNVSLDVEPSNDSTEDYFINNSNPDVAECSYCFVQAMYYR